MVTAYIINMFPVWSHPCVLSFLLSYLDWEGVDWCSSIIGRLIARPKKYVNRLKVLLGPMIEERWKNYRAYGKEWADKPVSYVFVP